MAPDWIDDARRRLLGLRRAPGAWGYRPGTSMAVEPSAMAGLALLATDPPSGGPGPPRPGHPRGRLERGEHGGLRHEAPPRPRPDGPGAAGPLGRRPAVEGHRPGGLLPPGGPGRDARAGLPGLGDARPPGLGG